MFAKGQIASDRFLFASKSVALINLLQKPRGGSFLAHILTYTSVKRRTFNRNHSNVNVLIISCGSNHETLLSYSNL